MTEPVLWISVTLASLAGLMFVTQTALKGWRGWLDLRLREIDRASGSSPPASPAGRIELADLKERVRKLEAIAAGVELEV